MRENTDYMQAAQTWIFIFVVFASPMVINLCIRICSGDQFSEILITYDLLTDNQKELFNANMYYSIA